MDFSAPDFRPDPALAVVGMCEETCKWKISICLPLSLCLYLANNIEIKKKEREKEREEGKKKKMYMHFISFTSSI